MYMKIKTNSVWIYAVAAAMMAAVSCAKDDAPTADNNILRFVAGLGPQTMAPIESDDNGLVTSGTITGIQIWRGRYGSTPRFNRLESVTCRTASLDGTGILTLNDTLNINTDGSTANFLGFYPLGSLDFGTETTPATVTYTIDGETDIIAANRVSKTYSASDNKVNLAFKHQLARLRFRCVCVDDANGALYQGISEAKIKVPKKAVMIIPDNGIITTVGKMSDPIVDSDYTELNFGTCEMSQEGEYAKKDLMILPDDALAPVDVIQHMQIGLKFAGFPDDAIRQYSLNNLKLVAGKTTTITVTVSGAEPLTISTTIEAWNAVDTGQGWVTE